MRRVLDSSSRSARASGSSAPSPSVMRSIVRNHRRTLPGLLALSFGVEVTEMLVPILVGWIIDVGIVQANLWLTLAGAAGVFALRLVSTWGWAAMFAASQRARMFERHRLRVAVTGAVLAPDSTPIQRPAGEVLSIATSDADKASDVMDMLPWVFPASTVVLASALWMAWLDPWLGLATLLGIVVMVLVIRVISPVLSARYDDQQSRAADAAATATDLVHGLRVLQGLGVQSRARAQYRRRSRTALDAALINARFSGISGGLTTLVTAGMMAAVVIIAAQRTLDGAMSLGTLIAVVGVARNNMGMLQGLSGVPVWWASMSTSGRRVRDLLGDLGRSLDDPRLSLDHLSTARDQRGDARHGERRGGVGGFPVPGLDLTVADGTVLAIACADPRDGEHLVTAIRRHSSLERSDLLIEPHLVDLFDGTVIEQLATRAPAGFDEADAAAAMHAAGAADLLEILPEGYETRILDRGANLSGGQRQRLALARAVAADAPVLVLHDPTTAVDAVTEQRIAEALIAARTLPDRATVLITRSPALLRAAGEVVFVQDGEITARGDHQNLMALSDYGRTVQR